LAFYRCFLEAICLCGLADHVLGYTSPSLGGFDEREGYEPKAFAWEIFRCGFVSVKQDLGGGSVEEKYPSYRSGSIGRGVGKVDASRDKSVEVETESIKTFSVLFVCLCLEISSKRHGFFSEARISFYEPGVEIELKSRIGLGVEDEVARRTEASVRVPSGGSSVKSGVNRGRDPELKEKFFKRADDSRLGSPPLQSINVCRRRRESF
jgi:hypothetical protein